MFSFSSKTKVIILKEFGVKAIRLLKYFYRKFYKMFFTYIDFVEAKLVLITTGSIRCKKLVYIFRFYLAFCDRFKILFRI